jgi:hypothetical protein
MEKVINHPEPVDNNHPTTDRQTDLGCEGASLGTTDPWFPNLKTARAAFRKLSNGELELLANVYRGDGHRHEVFHHACEQHSLISLRELQTLPPGKFCPHCHGTEDLLRFGTMENLQVSVCRESGHAAYFFACNPLGPADQEYTFWCVRHCRSYQATFSEFQHTKSKSNGCPLCEQEEKRGDAC